MAFDCEGLANNIHHERGRKKEKKCAYIHHKII